MTAPVGGATMADFADNGLTSDTDFGQACIQALGVPCAFGGRNPNQSAALFLQPIGRSVYNALQVKLVDNVASPMRGVKNLNFQIAYSLSRFENSGGAQADGHVGRQRPGLCAAVRRLQYAQPLLWPIIARSDPSVLLGRVCGCTGRFRNRVDHPFR